MKCFVEGALTCSYAVAAVFFLRFWRMTHDRLFVAFSGAFFMLAVNRLAITLIKVPTEHQHYLYVTRLVAYVVILAAIADKNCAKAAKIDGGRPSSSDVDPPLRQG